MKLDLRRRLASLLSFTLILTTVTLGQPASAAAGDPDTGSAAEGTAPPAEIVTLISSDHQTSLNFTDINPDEAALSAKSEHLALFTDKARVTDAVYDDDVLIREQSIALLVDADGIVSEVYGTDEDPPAKWDPEKNAVIPDGGYIVLAHDGSWDASLYRKPLFSGFKSGDRVKLMRDGMEVTAADFVKAAEPVPPPPGPVEKAELVLNNLAESTVAIPLVEVSGYVKNYTEGKGMRVTVSGKEAVLTASGSFKQNVYLNPGPNTVDVKLWEGDAELASVQLSVIYDREGQTEDYIEVEAAPADITIGVEGPRKKIDLIDKDITGIDQNLIVLYTRDYGVALTVPMYNVAVLVDGSGRVVQMVNPSVNGKPPVWTGPTELSIPDGGYVLMAQDNSYAGNDIKRFLAEKFKAHDPIKLRKNGEVVPVRDLQSGNGLIARLKIENPLMSTVTEPQTVLKGLIENIDDPSALVLTVNDAQVPFSADGSFTFTLSLQNGINYADVSVMKHGTEQDKRSLSVFLRPELSSKKDVILWVDQAANAKKFQSSQNVRDFLEQAKGAGVTSIVLDVKGVEGFVSYKKNDLTGRPYVSEIKAPQKAGANPDLDLLQEFITHGHALGLQIHAAINVFAEGSIAHQEFAVLNDHLDWEERVHFAENNGEIKRLRESAKQGLVAFVNPSNDEVRSYQLKTFEEIIKNYEVDGVVHDRGRYDNEGADFSEETRVKFERFLQARGKQLNNWPNDVFYYDQSVRVYGPLIQDWWEFRSGEIQSFFGEVKSLVDSYESRAGRSIKVSSYVGSWYETYYLNGVNWGSKNFRYDPRLGLPEESVYTPEYYNTGYIEHLDFLMIGAYQTTSSEVKKYITLGNIVTNGEIPLYAGIALNNVQDPAMQREVFQAGLNTTNGLMLFDASQANWPVIAASLQDKEWVKDYQLGMSLPGSPNDFLEGDYHNVNRVEDNINVMTDAFGPSTGTNRFGVEVVVSAAGEVTRVVNKQQAMQWKWGAPEENDSMIPQGGFVISAIDRSGVRERRQLVANAYSGGDQVRSAMLSGLRDDEGRQVASERVTVEGKVSVLGPGRAEVHFNGQTVPVNANGEFSADIPLSPGANMIMFEVFVDGLKTNGKAVEITRNDTPPAPERIQLTRETGPDGRTWVRGEVALEPMLQEIERAVQSNEKSPRLIYEIKEAADEVELVLPAGGVTAALEKIPTGMIVLDTSLGGLDLPVSSLKDGWQSGQQSEALVVGLGKLSEKSASDLEKLLSRQNVVKQLASVNVSLGLKQGSKTVALPSFKQGHAELTLPVSGLGDQGYAAAFKVDLAKRTLAVLPVALNGSGESRQAKLKVKSGGTVVVVQLDRNLKDRLDD